MASAACGGGTDIAAVTPLGIFVSAGFYYPVSTPESSQFQFELLGIGTAVGLLRVSRLRPAGSEQLSDDERIQLRPATSRSTCMDGGWQARYGQFDSMFQRLRDTAGQSQIVIYHEKCRPNHPAAS